MEYVFWLLVLLGPLILAHETGHFLFAKIFRVKVLVFSLGFGGPVRIGKWKLSKKINDTEYRVAWFPLGGFVRMLGDDPSEEIPSQEQEKSFSKKSAWKRFFIVLGGPLFSMLFALPVFFVFNLMLTEVPAAVVGRVIPGSPAAEAGMLAGDRIVKIHGRDVYTWGQIDTEIQSSEGRTLAITLVRVDKTLTFHLLPMSVQDQSGIGMFQPWDLGIRHRPQGDSIGVVSSDAPAAYAGLRSWDRVISLGGIPVHGWREMEKIIQGNGKHWLPVTAIRAKQPGKSAVFDVMPWFIETVIIPQNPERAPGGAWATSVAYTGIEPIDLYIENVSKGYPAEEQGVVSGDKIVSVLGKSISSWEEFSRRMEESVADKAIAITVRHEGKLRTIEFVPKTIVQTNEFSRQKTEKPGLGVNYRSNMKMGSYIERSGRIPNAFKMAFVETGKVIVIQVQGIAAIFKGKIKPRETVGGPLMIADLARKSAERGWRQFVSMMAFLSVFLGMINLLPIPILDGGHILFILIEAIFRHPVPLKARLVANYVGLFLLVSLMLFAITNDIDRYWFS